MSSTHLPRLLAAPNEDGAGPSALLSYIVRALLELHPGLHATVWNQSRQALNESLYQDYIAQGRVNVEPVWNLVQLARPAGQVSAPATLQLLGDYHRQRDEYINKLAEVEADLILDFGVPAAARWGAEHGVPSISVFDHSWSRTLEMIAERSTELSAIEQSRWQALVQAIREDEHHTSNLYLFPSMIAPPPFGEYWRAPLADERIRLMPGVLGGRGQWSRETAREFLRVTEPGPTILVLGGDSSVWDAPLESLVRAMLVAEGSGELDVNCIVYLPESLLRHTDLESELEKPQVRRVRRLRFYPGNTIQAILPAIDFLFARAGGGTVNDAIAARTPFVCVREPGQAQVEAILEACLARGLTRAVEWEAFAASPLSVILNEFNRQSENGYLAGRLADIQNGVEQEIAREIGSVMGWS